MDKLSSIDFADIIKAAAASPLGILSLCCLAIGLLAYSFFREASEKIRVFIFILLLVSVLGSTAAVYEQSRNAQTGAMGGDPASPVSASSPQSPVPNGESPSRASKGNLKNFKFFDENLNVSINISLEGNWKKEESKGNVNIFLRKNGKTVDVPRIFKNSWNYKWVEFNRGVQRPFSNYDKSISIDNSINYTQFYIKKFLHNSMNPLPVVSVKSYPVYSELSGDIIDQIDLYFLRKNNSDHEYVMSAVLMPKIDGYNPEKISKTEFTCTDMHGVESTSKSECEHIFRDMKLMR